MPKRTHDGIKKRCGCPRRQWPKCTHPWHFSFHHGGHEHRYSLDVVASARGEQPPTTKADAAKWRDRLRSEIREGTFAEPDGPAQPATLTDTRLTFGDIADRYVKDHVHVPTRRPAARAAMEWHVALLCRTEVPAAHGTTIALASKPLDEITKADVEAVRAARRAAHAQALATLAAADALGADAATASDKDEARRLRREARTLRRAARCRPGEKGGEVGINRLLARLRHMFSWAIEQGYADQTPFRRAGKTIVRLERGVENARTRRLEPGEEEALLRHAGEHLRALIVAALSTGCRIGELLSLQWQQIRRDDNGQARWIVLPAAKTKTAEARVIPIGPRLRGALEMRRVAPDGHDHAAAAYVFGNEVGEPVGSVRKAWRLTCRRAGINDLHMHDLRREFGSRLLESGASEHDVRDFLGHANITTTSRYLKSTPLRLERALAQMEAGAIRTPFAHKPAPVNEIAAGPRSEGSQNPVIQ